MAEAVYKVFVSIAKPNARNWNPALKGSAKGSIACSPLFPCRPFLLPVACQSMQLQLLFDFAFVLCAAGKRASRGRRDRKGRWRELTYKSSNGHSLWFGLAAPPLSGRRTCVNICAKCGCSLTDTKHSPSFWAVCVCVCVWWAGGMVSSWVWFELGFSSNCSACCCWFSFGNLCSVCIVCRSVSLCHSERQAFSCLNLSCIMWPMKQSKRKQNIEQSSHKAREEFSLQCCRSFLSFFNCFFFFFLQISYWIFQLFPLAKSSTSLLLLNFRFYILVRLLLLHLPFSLYAHTHSPLPCHRWTSVLQFICYGIEFHLAVFFYISDGAQRGVCGTYLPCVIDNAGQKKNIWN